jgi:translation initiation factor 3 subunit L
MSIRAIFMELSEDDLKTALICLRHNMKNLIWQKDTSGLDGDFQSASEVDFFFYIYIDMIHIADTKVARRYGDFFIR